MRLPEVREYFTQYLKHNQHRVTVERFEVLDAVQSADGHFDADQLFLNMKNAGSKVSRATVYNTLEKLMDCGILARYQFGDRPMRYELMYDNEPHHHMICRSCGKIEEFVDRRVDRMARDAAETMHYELHDAALHIFGVCGECRERNAVNQPETA